MCVKNATRGGNGREGQEHQRGGQRSARQVLCGLGVCEQDLGFKYNGRILRAFVRVGLVRVGKRLRWLLGRGQEVEVRAKSLGSCHGQWRDSGAWG